MLLKNLRRSVALICAARASNARWISMLSICGMPPTATARNSFRLAPDGRRIGRIQARKKSSFLSIGLDVSFCGRLGVAIPYRHSNLFCCGRPVSDGGRHAQTRGAANVSSRVNQISRRPLPPICFDVSRFVQLDLTAKHLRVRGDADADENAFGLDGFDFMCASVFDDQSFHTIAAFDSPGFGVVDDRDPRVLPSLFDPVFARAVSVRTVDE